MSIREHEAVNLVLNWIDSNAWISLEASHVDLVVEVANVAYNSVVLHLGHVGGHDDAFVAGASDVDIGCREHRLETSDFKAFHAGLKGADGVNFGDDNTSTAVLHSCSTALANITISTDDDLLTSDHDVGSTHEAISDRVTATIDVVELLLGD